MSKITVSLDVTDAMLAQIALDTDSAKAYREARGLIESGQITSAEYVIADATAKALDRVGRALSSALYPDPVEMAFCAWFGENDCHAPVTGHAGDGRGYCDSHLTATLLREQRQAALPF